MGQELISDPGAVATLERADALHTALSHIVLEGGDLDRIAEEVAHALHCGVVFTSTDGRERAAHLDEGMRRALTDADLVDATGRLRVEHTDDGAPVGAGEALGLRVAAAGVDLARLVAISPMKSSPASPRCAVPKRSNGTRRSHHNPHAPMAAKGKLLSTSSACGRLSSVRWSAKWW